MQRPLQSVALVLSLALVACSSESAPASSVSTSVAGTSNASELDEGAREAGTMAAKASIGTQAPVTSPSEPDGAPQDPEPQEKKPQRTPKFNFGPDGSIPDADLTKYHVVLRTSIDAVDVGAITVGLWGDKAPITVRNFLRLSDEGFYDGLSFHRIMRDFMVQGGDPTGSGMGSSPHGTIKAEFSDDPSRAHRYGVLSMARSSGRPDSASSQFFICCDESPGVWNLDGQYSSFGRITSGVKTLEALADVPTGGRERSSPSKSVLITRAEVVEGPTPTGETIERPEVVPELNGEPAKVVIQHCLLSFDQVPRIKAKRTKEEAEKLAGEIAEKVRAGEDLVALVREHSDDPVQPDDESPGVYRLLNNGVRDRVAERQMYELTRDFQKFDDGLREKQKAGELTAEQVTAQSEAERQATIEKLDELRWAARSGMVPGFGNVAFSLKVGEVGISAFDADDSPFGWHVIKRLE
ncbi:MAG: hypothetical protein GY711_16360 [bacterium]|nr:hypothetical protein [bacterium]